ncbi:hypothetical protein ABPG75_007902 [Micractinium tetrahymenae]
MATLEAVPPVQAETPGGSAPSPNDGVLLHPYLFSPALKVPLKLSPSLKKQLAKQCNSKQGEEFVAQLEQARSRLTTALESPSVSDAAVNEAVSGYVALLLGLVAAGGGATSGAANAAMDAAAAAAATPDEALAAVEGGAAPNGAGSTSPLTAPPSRLRHAVQWGWAEAVLAPPPGSQPRSSGAADAAYELASVLLAAALRLAHAAAEASKDSASGVPTPAATRSYRLLREAAGLVELVAGQLAPALPAGLSADLDPQVVRALCSVALADAQQLTMLRAVAKGNQPSLIAALGVDTAAMYGQACSQLATAAAAGAASSKLWQYGQYKQAYCLAYAHGFNGIALWRADKPGEGLKSLEAAAGQLAAARRASSAYNAAPPASLNLHHRRADEDLERIIADTQRRMQKENDTVYVQRVAAEVPPLPAGKRLASPLPYVLPQPAPAVRGGVVEQCFGQGPAPAAAAVAMAAPAAQAMHAGGTAAAHTGGAAGASAAGVTTAAGGGGSSEQGCSCCRWLGFMIACPILVALWLVGAVLWVLLLPLKCCCPCLGLPLQWLIDAMLGLMKLPARGLLWATGGEAKESGGGRK